MDILDRFLISVEEALGPDVFTPELSEKIERKHRICDGSEAHYVTGMKSFEVEQRHMEVRRLIGAGLGNSEIAERTGLTRQQVWNIRQTV